ncbi:hypothetical protein BDF14DRAFT_1342784 [Spinellus fusiger]|nr:hypothetical protein BDF14DRAFT_1342784 [Spinellus fusiger]
MSQFVQNDSLTQRPRKPPNSQRRKSKGNGQRKDSTKQSVLPLLAPSKSNTHAHLPVTYEAPTPSHSQPHTEKTIKKEAVLSKTTLTSQDVPCTEDPTADIPMIRLPTAKLNLPLMDDGIIKSYDSVDDGYDTDDSDGEDVEKLLDFGREVSYWLYYEDLKDKKAHPHLYRATKRTQLDITYNYPYLESFPPSVSMSRHSTVDTSIRRMKSAHSAVSDQEPDFSNSHRHTIGGKPTQDHFMSPILEPQGGRTSKVHYSWNPATATDIGSVFSPVTTSADVSPLEKEARPRRSTIDGPMAALQKAYEPFSLRPPPQLTKTRRGSRQGLFNESPMHSPVRREREASRSQGASDDARSNTNSAVSPRFMALRKLSESGMVPTINSSTKRAQQPTDNYDVFQTQLLQRIDEAIETQVQSNIRQILWKASESHMDARRFWEEQKNEMLEFGTSMVKRLEAHAQATKSLRRESKAEAGNLAPTQELDLLRKQQIDMENEISTYRIKYINLQRQVFEMDLLRARNNELEKQYDWIRERNVELENTHASSRVHLNRINGLESQIAHLNQAHTTLLQIDSSKSKLEEIVSHNLQLEAEVAKQTEINQHLLKKITSLEEEASVRE